MNFSEAMKYINSFSHTGGKIVNLSRIGGLMERLGNPQDKLKFVHIAGTNGKGSVLELTSQSVINAGYKTGQFTSPFIECYCDRIRINGENISEKKIGQLCDKVKDAVYGNEYSQFEITLAIAFLYYLEEKCDIVFLETGVGGKLDATNIIKNPIVSAITSISFDHVQILGHTLKEIATQKAGIIKKNRPVVLSFGNKSEVVDTVKHYANIMQSKLTIPTNPQIISKNIFGSKFKYNNEIYDIRMPGEHQIINAATSIEVIKILKENGMNISDSAVKKAFVQTTVGARTEFISGKPDIIIDGGHNVSGVTSLAATLSMIGERHLVALCGMVNTKDYSKSAEILSDIFDHVICVDGFIENSVEAVELSKKFLCNTQTMNYIDGFAEGKKIALQKNGTLVVCGSLYLASAIKNIISHHR